MATATMTATSPQAFLLSATLHGVVIALALLFSYTASRQSEEAPKILELVAGEGDNFAAREAPALGTPGGIKVSVPEAPAPRPAPPEPVAPPPVTPAPVTPTPPPVTKATPAPKTAPVTNPDVPDFKKKIQRAIVVGDSKAKLQIKKEREAEAKRLREEQKRLSKEEFDRAQRAKAAGSAATSTAKIAKIDSEGIAKGVIGGSPNNKVGGAGGKALRNDSDDVLGMYYAMFKTRLRAEFEPPPGLSDSLKATVEVRSNPDGSLTNARIVRGSGSKDFDNSVLDAIRRVKMPPRPTDKKAETIEFVFTMRERDEG
jgi:colicin import membrane protein